MTGADDGQARPELFAGFHIIDDRSPRLVLPEVRRVTKYVQAVLRSGEGNVDPI